MSNSVQCHWPCCFWYALKSQKNNEAIKYRWSRVHLGNLKAMNLRRTKQWFQFSLPHPPRKMSNQWILIAKIATFKSSLLKCANFLRYRSREFFEIAFAIGGGRAKNSLFWADALLAMQILEALFEPLRFMNTDTAALWSSNEQKDVPRKQILLKVCELYTQTFCTKCTQDF